MNPARGLAAAGVMITLLAGCADLKSDLPAPNAPGVRVHEASWLDTASANFHGDVVKATNGNAQSCLTCHGLNYQGGTSGVSCVSCHQAKGATLHGKGWITPSSPNFHGNTIRAANWDMSVCQTCHGTLFDGGKVGSSCRDCHQGAAGPENCSTCHGSATSVAPPRDLSKNTARSARGVGAHQIHLLGSSIAGPMLCANCHTTPGAVSTPGHIDATPRAEVLFNNPLAKTMTNVIGTTDYDTGNPVVTPNPSYDQSTLKCSNAYCHGYFKNGNQNFAPVWNDTTGSQGTCGTCHGDVTQPLNSGFRAMPRSTSQGGTHPDIAGAGIACSVCHGDVVDANFKIINPQKHINGKLNVFGEERTW